MMEPPEFQKMGEGLHTCIHVGYVLAPCPLLPRLLKQLYKSRCTPQYMFSAFPHFLNQPKNYLFSFDQRDLDNFN